MNNVSPIDRSMSTTVNDKTEDIILSVEHLCKAYGGDETKAAELAITGRERTEIVDECGSFMAVSDATFEVRRGEIFVIMGLSGSGKSTLLRCVNRLIRPTAGKVTYGDENLLNISEKRLRALRLTKISMVFQQFALLPHKTVIDNVAFGLKVRGVNKPARYETAMALLAKVGLVGWEKLYPRNLSGGMKQRVGLARSLAVDPDILLMDEAFSALDPLIRREMQDELRRLQTELNKTIIFITHDIQEALLLGDRIAMMKDGRIVQCGTPAELMLKPADAFVANFTRDADRARLLSARDIMMPLEDYNALTSQCDGFVVKLADDGAVYAINTKHADAPEGTPERVEVQLVDETKRIGDLLPLVTSSSPIVVVNAKGGILGAVTREGLFKVLSTHR